MNDVDYWKECIDIYANNCALELTEGQLTCLAEGVQSGYDTECHHCNGKGKVY